MTVTCPEGHRSEATDYCDTCGAPIGAAESGAEAGSGMQVGPGFGAGASPAGGPALPGQPGAAAGGSVLDLDPAGPIPTITCPHCGGINLEDALFCEACGYDFTTGAAPLDDEPVEQQSAAVETEQKGMEQKGTEPAVDAPGAEVEPTVAVAEADASEESAPGELEPVGPVPAQTENDDQVAGEADDIDAEVAGASKVPGGADSVEPEGEDGPEDGGPQPEAAPAPAPTPPPTSEARPAHPRPRHTPPSRDLADAWVVEMWVDPDWYAVQQTDEACPSAGVPDIVVVRRNVVLVGRPSGSLGVRPDVDAGADSAVSRRHAQLTSDGTRWWIEDLGSSNGTFVGVVGDPLPTEPLAPGQRVEIDRDDRIYVGAWTRLVIRQATESEKAGQG